VDQVAKNAYRLSSEVNCDKLVLLSAAYFHDVVSRFSGQGYTLAVEKSAKVAGEELRKLGLSAQCITRIQSCIRTASWEFAASGGSPDSIEAYVLRDADFLEATGAHGLARVFAFSGSAGRPINWHDVDLNFPPRLPPSLKGAKET